MLYSILAVSRSADEPSKSIANVAVGAMFVGCFVKFIQMVFFRKKDPKNNPGPVR